MSILKKICDHKLDEIKLLKNNFTEKYLLDEKYIYEFYSIVNKGYGISMKSGLLHEIDNIQYHLTNRFGTPPPPVKNLIQECRLRLLAAQVGVLSLRTRGCGVVCKIMKNNSAEFISSVLEYMSNFFTAVFVINIFNYFISSILTKINIKIRHRNTFWI